MRPLCEDEERGPGFFSPSSQLLHGAWRSLPMALRGKAFRTARQETNGPGLVASGTALRGYPVPFLGPVAPEHVPHSPLCRELALQPTAWSDILGLSF